MAFATSNTLIQRFADALFGAQVGSTTLSQVIADSGNTGINGLKSVFNTYYAQSFSSMTTGAVADMMLVNLGIAVGKSGLLAADVKVARDYITSNLNSTPSGQRGEMVSSILNLFSNLTTDATFGAAATAFNGAIAGAEVWSANNTNNAPIGTANTFNLTVGADNIFGTASNDLFVANVVQNSQGQQVNTLGSGDILNGNGGMDMLSAKITAGAYVNGGSGYWQGGTYQNQFQGTSTMPIQPETHGIQTVKLQAVNSAIAGSNLPDNNNSAGSTEVFVNAKDMLDVTNISSNHSDANLTIQNLTTLNSDGSRHALNTDRVGMAFTGNSDSGWKESDLHVYFDQDYLIPLVTTGASVDIRLMNQDAYDFSKGVNGLGVQSLNGAIASTYISQFKITLNGTPYDLSPFLKAADAGNSLYTYADELAAIQAAIVKLKAANPSDAALQTLTATIDPKDTFTADAAYDSTNNTTGPVRVGQSVTLTVTGSGSVNSLTVDSLLLSAVSQSNTNMNLFNRSLPTPSTLSSNLAINVDLTKVGNWGDGGSLVIGSMYKDGLNTWSDQYAGKGINEFDVVVHGTKVTFGDDQSSSLKQLASTGNNLEVVKVVSDPLVTANATTAFADLTIGNTQTENAYGILSPLVAGSTTVTTANSNALKDVQIFDASLFKGNLNLFAALTSEVTAKYLNVVDGSPAAAADDNVHFAYTGGAGNDYINLSLSAANLAQPGTATREDFTLTVDGGAGNDVIVVKIDDEAFKDNSSSGSSPYVSLSHWYENQHYTTANLKLVGGIATGQLQINGGAGDDTIRKLGAGDFAINTGAGNDTVYAENTGADTTDGGAAFGYQFNEGRGVAVFNALDATAYGTSADTAHYDVDNLLSDHRALYFVGTKAEPVTQASINVTVNFLGFVSSVAVASVAGSTTGSQSITDLMINQAIKTAINSDAVLSKLAIAEDGPGHTLVLRSLIDGDLGADLVTGQANNGNYEISLTAITGAAGNTTLTATQINDAFGTHSAGSGATSRSVYDNEIGQDVRGDYHTGADSTAPSDNLIAVGLGNDVIVLGTAGYHKTADSTDAPDTNSDQLHGSNDTVSFSGYGVRDTTIVNFDTTNSKVNTKVFEGAGFDHLNFSSYKVSGVMVTTDAATSPATDSFNFPSTLPAAYDYVKMVEVLANAGEYNVTVMHHAASGPDTLVGTVGVLDFGHHEAFIASSFIIG